MRPDLVLTGGTVIDGTGSPPVRADIAVVGPRVAAVAGHLDTSAAVATIDCHDKFIIPGLWDGHVHLMQDGAWTREFVGEFDEELVRANLNSSLRAGVTSVIDVMGSPYELASLKARQLAGRLPGTATLYFAGPGVTAPGGHPAGTMMNGRPEVASVLTRQVSDASAARAAVDEIIERYNVDVIKAFYTSLWGQRDLTRPDVLAAVVDAAAGHGRSVVTHVDWGPEAAEAIRCGVRGLEHIPREGSRGLAFALAAEAGVIWTPTLAVFDSFTHAGELRWIDDQRQRGAPPHMLTSLAESGSTWLDLPDPRVASMMEARIDGVRRAHAAGVTIASGTDAGANGTFHGIAVHRELELLVQAGLSPLEAITAGTRNPPRKLNLETTVGTLVEGMRADLVVLDDDPLVDIANTRAISAVVLAGTLT